MFKTFYKILDKYALKSLVEHYDEIDSMPAAAQVVIADMIQEQFFETLKYEQKARKPLEYSEHLHIIGKESGKIKKKIQNTYGDTWLHLCKLKAASLTEALYHCLQCEKSENVLYAKQKTIEFIATSKKYKIDFAHEVKDILNGYKLPGAE